MLKFIEPLDQRTSFCVSTADFVDRKIVKPLFPVVWEAFEDYRMGGMFLSRLDRGVIERLMSAGHGAGAAPPFDEQAFLAAQDPDWVDLKRSRERDECREKLQRLGVLRKDEG